ncbi:MAG TPA: Nramp family divalent metal transporter [Bacteroidia bacterium]|jgi:NRAMP (natural resistance-associated macrophage protein)-like metal ion transporter|nr:Nramp family divalent metal transporter [Bacteroidia bacterium]
MKEFTSIKKTKAVWKSLGPGFITGASDDDPSGIATYSQAGAAFGLGTLWTAFITFPLMAAIQEMCARIGMVTSNGLTSTLKTNYSKPLLYLMILFSFPAIVLNIGADIAGMGAVANLLYPEVHSNIFSLIFVTILIISLIYFPYRKIADVMKWLCLILLVYAIVPFLIKQDGWAILRASFIPKLHWDKEYIMILVAILGTTISPYLFFWQAAMEGEEKAIKKQLIIDKSHINEMRTDVNIGMLFSNIVMYFIILTTGSVLFKNGITQIHSVQDAAGALKPLAGESAYLMFAIGIIGTGFLAIPVLAGSLSYMLAETFGWEEGLNKKWHEAKGFYLVLIVSILTGFIINLCGIDPIKALVFSGVVYGVTAPVLIAIVLHICNNKKIMGDFTNGLRSNILGVLTLLIMTIAAVALFLTL